MTENPVEPPFEDPINEEFAAQLVGAIRDFNLNVENAADIEEWTPPQDDAEDIAYATAQPLHERLVETPPFFIPVDQTLDDEIVNNIRGYQLPHEASRKLLRFGKNVRKAVPELSRRSGRTLLQSIINSGCFATYMTDDQTFECRALVAGQFINFKLERSGSNGASTFSLSGRHRYELTDEVAEQLANQPDLNELARRISWEGPLSVLVRLVINPGQGRVVEGIQTGMQFFRAVYSSAPGVNHEIALHAQIDNNHIERVIADPEIASVEESLFIPEVDSPHSAIEPVDFSGFLENMSSIDISDEMEDVQRSGTPVSRDNSTGSDAISDDTADQLMRDRALEKYMRDNPSVSREEAEEVINRVIEEVDKELETMENFTINVMTISRAIDKYYQNIDDLPAEERDEYLRDMDEIHNEVNRELVQLEGQIRSEQRSLDRVRFNNPLHGSYGPLLWRRQMALKTIDKLEKQQLLVAEAFNQTVAESDSLFVNDTDTFAEDSREWIDLDKRICVLKATINLIDARLPTAREQFDLYKLSKLNQKQIVARLRRRIEQEISRTLSEFQLAKLYDWVDDLFISSRLRRRATAIVEEEASKKENVAQGVSEYHLDVDCITLIRRYDETQGGLIQSYAAEKSLSFEAYITEKIRPALAEAVPNLNHPNLKRFPTSRTDELGEPIYLIARIDENTLTDLRVDNHNEVVNPEQNHREQMAFYKLPELRLREILRFDKTKNNQELRNFVREYEEPPRRLFRKVIRPGHGRIVDSSRPDIQQFTIDGQDLLVQVKKGVIADIRLKNRKNFRSMALRNSSIGNQLGELSSLAAQKDQTLDDFLLSIVRQVPGQAIDPAYPAYAKYPTGTKNAVGEEVFVILRVENGRVRDAWPWSDENWESIAQYRFPQAAAKRIAAREVSKRNVLGQLAGNDDIVSICRFIKDTVRHGAGEVLDPSIPTLKVYEAKDKNDNDTTLLAEVVNGEIVDVRENTIENRRRMKKQAQLSAGLRFHQLQTQTLETLFERLQQDRQTRRAPYKNVFRTDHGSGGFIAELAYGAQWNFADYLKDVLTTEHADQLGEDYPSSMVRYPTGSIINGEEVYLLVRRGGPELDYEPADIRIDTPKNRQLMINLLRTEQKDVTVDKVIARLISRDRVRGCPLHFLASQSGCSISQFIRDTVTSKLAEGVETDHPLVKRLPSGIMDHGEEIHICVRIDEHGELADAWLDMSQKIEVPARFQLTESMRLLCQYIKVNPNEAISDIDVNVLNQHSALQEESTQDWLTQDVPMEVDEASVHGTIDVEAPALQHEGKPYVFTVEAELDIVNGAMEQQGLWRDVLLCLGSNNDIFSDADLLKIFLENLTEGEYLLPNEVGDDPSCRRYATGAYNTLGEPICLLIRFQNNQVCGVQAVVSRYSDIALDLDFPTTASDHPQTPITLHHEAEPIVQSDPTLHADADISLTPTHTLDDIDTYFQNVDWDALIVEYNPQSASIVAARHSPATRPTPLDDEDSVIAAEEVSVGESMNLDHLTRQMEADQYASTELNIASLREFFSSNDEQHPSAAVQALFSDMELPPIPLTLNDIIGDQELADREQLPVASAESEVLPRVEVLKQPVPLDLNESEFIMVRCFGQGNGEGPFFQREQTNLTECGPIAADCYLLSRVDENTGIDENGRRPITERQFHRIASLRLYKDPLTGQPAPIDPETGMCEVIGVQFTRVQIDAIVKESMREGGAEGLMLEAYLAYDAEQHDPVLYERYNGRPVMQIGLSEIDDDIDADMLNTLINDPTGTRKRFILEFGAGSIQTGITGVNAHYVVFNRDQRTNLWHVSGTKEYQPSEHLPSEIIEEMKDDFDGNLSLRLFVEPNVKDLLIQFDLVRIQRIQNIHYALNAIFQRKLHPIGFGNHVFNAVFGGADNLNAVSLLLREEGLCEYNTTHVVDLLQNLLGNSAVIQETIDVSLSVLDVATRTRSRGNGSAVYDNLAAGCRKAIVQLNELERQFVAITRNDDDSPWLVVGHSEGSDGITLAAFIKKQYDIRKANIANLEQTEHEQQSILDNAMKAISVVALSPNVDIEEAGQIISDHFDSLLPNVLRKTETTRPNVDNQSENAPSDEDRDAIVNKKKQTKKYANSNYLTYRGGDPKRHWQRKEVQKVWEPLLKLLQNKHTKRRPLKGLKKLDHSIMSAIAKACTTANCTPFDVRSKANKLLPGFYHHPVTLWDLELEVLIKRNGKKVTRMWLLRVQEHVNDMQDVLNAVLLAGKRSTALDSQVATVNLELSSQQAQAISRHIDWKHWEPILKAWRNAVPEAKKRSDAAVLIEVAKMLSPGQGDPIIDEFGNELTGIEVFSLKPWECSFNVMIFHDTQRPIAFRLLDVNETKICDRSAAEKDFRIKASIAWVIQKKLEVKPQADKGTFDLFIQQAKDLMRYEQRMRNLLELINRFHTWVDGDSQPNLHAPHYYALIEMADACKNSVEKIVADERGKQIARAYTYDLDLWGEHFKIYILRNNRKLEDIKLGEQTPDFKYSIASDKSKKEILNDLLFTLFQGRAKRSSQQKQKQRKKQRTDINLMHLLEEASSNSECESAEGHQSDPSTDDQEKMDVDDKAHPLITLLLEELNIVKENETVRGKLDNHLDKLNSIRQKQASTVTELAKAKGQNAEFEVLDGLRLQLSERDLLSVLDLEQRLHYQLLQNGIITLMQARAIDQSDKDTVRRERSNLKGRQRVFYEKADQKKRLDDAWKYYMSLNPADGRKKGALKRVAELPAQSGNEPTDLMVNLVSLAQEEAQILRELAPGMKWIEIRDNKLHHVRQEQIKLLDSLSEPQHEKQAEFLSTIVDNLYLQESKAANAADNKEQLRLQLCQEVLLLLHKRQIPNCDLSSINPKLNKVRERRARTSIELGLVKDQFKAMRNYYASEIASFSATQQHQTGPGTKGFSQTVKTRSRLSRNKRTRKKPAKKATAPESSTEMEGVEYTGPANIVEIPSTPEQQHAYLWKTNNKAPNFTETEAAISQNLREIAIDQNFPNGVIAEFANQLYDVVEKAKQSASGSIYIANTEADSNYSAWLARLGVVQGTSEQPAYLYNHLLNLCSENRTIDRLGDQFPRVLENPIAIEAFLASGMKFTIQEWQDLSASLVIVAEMQEWKERNFRSLQPRKPPILQHGAGWLPIGAVERPTDLYIEPQQSANCSYHALNMTIGARIFGERQARESIFRVYLEARIRGESEVKGLSFERGQRGILARLHAAIENGDDDEVRPPRINVSQSVKDRYIAKVIQKYNDESQPLEDTLLNIDDEEGVIQDFSLQSRGQLSYALCLKMFHDHLPIGLEFGGINFDKKGDANKLEESFRELAEQLQQTNKELGLAFILDTHADHFIPICVLSDGLHLADSQGYGDDDEPCFHRIPGNTREEQWRHLATSVRSAFNITEENQHLHNVAVGIGVGSRENILAFRNTVAPAGADSLDKLRTLGQKTMAERLKKLKVTFTYRYPPDVDSANREDRGFLDNPCAMVAAMALSSKLQNAAQESDTALDRELKNFAAVIERLLANVNANSTFHLTPNGISNSLLTAALSAYKNDLEPPQIPRVLTENESVFKTFCQQSHQCGERILLTTDENRSLDIKDRNKKSHGISAGHNICLIPERNANKDAPLLWRLVEPFSEEKLNKSSKTLALVNKHRPLITLSELLTLGVSGHAMWSVPPTGRVSITKKMSRESRRSKQTLTSGAPVIDPTAEKTPKDSVAKMLSHLLNVSIDAKDVIGDESEDISIHATIDKLKQANTNLNAFTTLEGRSGQIKDEKFFKQFEHSVKTAFQKNECNAFILSNLPGDTSCVVIRLDHARRLIVDVQPLRELKEYIKEMGEKHPDWSGDASLIGISGPVKELESSTEMVTSRKIGKLRKG